MLIKSIYGRLQGAYFWFKGYINTTTLKAVFKQWKNDPCLLYRVNEFMTIITIVYVDYTLPIGYESLLMDTIELINK